MNSIIYHTYKAGSSGLQFCLNHPLILQKILYFSIRTELHLLHHRQLRPARLFAICRRVGKLFLEREERDRTEQT